MIVKLLTKHHFEFLSLKGGCRGSSESTLVKMSNCLKSYASAHFFYRSYLLVQDLTLHSSDSHLRDISKTHCIVK